MSDDRDYEEMVLEALEKGKPLPPFPQLSPMEGLAMAQHEAVTTWVKAGFSRGEALYMVAAMFCGNPGASPNGAGEGS